MSGAARRSAEKEAFWRLVFEEHRASGQSVRAFCKQESISEASFYAWRKELERRDHGIKQTREQSWDATKRDRSNNELDLSRLSCLVPFILSPNT